MKRALSFFFSILFLAMGGVAAWYAAGPCPKNSSVGIGFAAFLLLVAGIVAAGNSVEGETK